MENYSITRKKIDELLRFLPLFDVPGREFIERWGGGEKLDNGSMTFPYPVCCQDVKEFVNCAGEGCWRDYNYHPVEVTKILENPDFINLASLENIKTILTYFVRGERFCDGHWGAMLASGNIVAVLKRLQILRESVVD